MPNIYSPERAREAIAAADDNMLEDAEDVEAMRLSIQELEARAIEFYHAAASLAEIETKLQEDPDGTRGELARLLGAPNGAPVNGTDARILALEAARDQDGGEVDPQVIEELRSQTANELDELRRTRDELERVQHRLAQMRNARHTLELLKEMKETFAAVHHARSMQGSAIQNPEDMDELDEEEEEEDDDQDGDQQQQQDDEDGDEVDEEEADEEPMASYQAGAHERERERERERGKERARAMEMEHERERERERERQRDRDFERHAEERRAQRLRLMQQQEQERNNRHAQQQRETDRQQQQQHQQQQKQQQKQQAVATVRSYKEEEEVDGGAEGGSMVLRRDDRRLNGIGARVPPRVSPSKGPGPDFSHLYDSSAPSSRVASAANLRNVASPELTRAEKIKKRREERELRIAEKQSRGDVATARIAADRMGTARNGPISRFRGRQPETEDWTSEDDRYFDQWLSAEDERNGPRRNRDVGRSSRYGGERSNMRSAEPMSYSNPYESVREVQIRPSSSMSAARDEERELQSNLERSQVSLQDLKMAVKFANTLQSDAEREAFFRDFFSLPPFDVDIDEPTQFAVRGRSSSSSSGSSNDYSRNRSSRPLRSRPEAVDVRTGREGGYRDRSREEREEYERSSVGYPYGATSASAAAYSTQQYQRDRDRQRQRERQQAERQPVERQPVERKVERGVSADGGSQLRYALPATGNASSIGRGDSSISQPLASARRYETANQRLPAATSSASVSAQPQAQRSAGRRDRGAGAGGFSADTQPESEDTKFRELETLIRMPYTTDALMQIGRDRGFDLDLGSRLATLLKRLQDVGGEDEEEEEEESKEEEEDDAAQLDRFLQYEIAAANARQVSETAPGASRSSNSNRVSPSNQMRITIQAPADDETVSSNNLSPSRRSDYLGADDPLGSWRSVSSYDYAEDAASESDVTTPTEEGSDISDTERTRRAEERAKKRSKRRREKEEEAKRRRMNRSIGVGTVSTSSQRTQTSPQARDASRNLSNAALLQRSSPSANVASSLSSAATGNTGTETVAGSIRMLAPAVSGVTRRWERDSEVVSNAATDHSVRTAAVSVVNSQINGAADRESRYRVPSSQEIEIRQKLRSLELRLHLRIRQSVMETIEREISKHLDDVAREVADVLTNQQSTASQGAQYQEMADLISSVWNQDGQSEFSDQPLSGQEQRARDRNEPMAEQYIEDDSVAGSIVSNNPSQASTALRDAEGMKASIRQWYSDLIGPESVQPSESTASYSSTNYDLSVRPDTSSFLSHMSQLMHTTDAKNRSPRPANPTMHAAVPPAFVSSLSEMVNNGMSNSRLNQSHMSSARANNESETANTSYVSLSAGHSPFANEPKSSSAAPHQASPKPVSSFSSQPKTSQQSPTMASPNLVFSFNTVGRPSPSTAATNAFQIQRNISPRNPSSNNAAAPQSGLGGSPFEPIHQKTTSDLLAEMGQASADVDVEDLPNSRFVFDENRRGRPGGAVADDIQSLIDKHHELLRARFDAEQESLDRQFQEAMAAVESGLVGDPNEGVVPSSVAMADQRSLNQPAASSERSNQIHSPNRFASAVTHSSQSGSENHGVHVTPSSVQAAASSSSQNGGNADQEALLHTLSLTDRLNKQLLQSFQSHLQSYQPSQDDDEEEDGENRSFGDSEESSAANEFEPLQEENDLQSDQDEDQEAEEEEDADPTAGWPDELVAHVEEVLRQHQQRADESADGTAELEPTLAARISDYFQQMLSERGIDVPWPTGGEEEEEEGEIWDEEQDEEDDDLDNRLDNQLQSNPACEIEELEDEPTQPEQAPRSPLQEKRTVPTGNGSPPVFHEVPRVIPVTGTDGDEEEAEGEEEGEAEAEEKEEKTEAKKKKKNKKKKNKKKKKKAAEQPAN